MRYLLREEEGQMKTLVLLCATGALFFAGCASDRHHYTGYRTHTDHYGDRTVVVQPGDRVVVDDRSGRTFVRDYDARRHHDNPRVRLRGKHPDALGWNDPYWYRY